MIGPKFAETCNFREAAVRTANIAWQEIVLLTPPYFKGIRNIYVLFCDVNQDMIVRVAAL